MTAPPRVAGGALIALILVLPAAGRAQVGTWELNVHGGALRHEVLGTDADPDPLVGARFERWSEGGWGVNGTVDWVGIGERRLIGFEAPTRLDGRLLRYTLGVDRSLALGERAGLALGAGIGAATAWYDVQSPDAGSTDESETSVVVPVSGRVTVLNAARSWGLALGVRDDILFLDRTDPLGNERDGVAHQLQGTVGLSLFFGKPGRSPERPRVESRDEPVASMPGEGDARMAGDRALAEIRQPIYFAFDRSELEGPSRATLQRKADVLREWPGARVVVEGHADERGTVEYNLALGERRAQVARSYLIDLGIDGDRLTTVSYGEERPVGGGHNEASWKLDRRDEFVPSGI